MTTQTSTKLAALGVALVMNSLMMCAVAYLFSSAVHTHTAHLAQTTAQTSVGQSA